MQDSTGPLSSYRRRHRYLIRMTADRSLYHWMAMHYRLFGSALLFPKHTLMTHHHGQKSSC